MDVNNQGAVPQAIQDVIQVTVDRAIATLLESGLLNSKLKKKKRDCKKRRSRSRSRSHSKGKKGKSRKRSSSSSSSSSSSDSDDDEERKCKGKKGKGRKRSHSRSHSRGPKHKGKGRRSRSRSHSRGRRSRSKSHPRHGKKGWRHPHHDSAPLLPFYQHYFNCPYVWTEGDESGDPKHVFGRKGKKHFHKKYLKKFYCPVAGAQITDEDKKNNADSDKETDLSKEFESLDVLDKEKSQ